MSRRPNGGRARARTYSAFRSVRLATLIAFVVGLRVAQAQPSPPISPNSTVRILFSFFSKSTSKQPISLIKATTGLFYGTTVGGEGDGGSVFSISEDGTFETLHFFYGSDGDLPYGQLFEGDDGSLYGTTIFGGATDQGTVFRITPDALFTILHHFGSDPSDGTHPWGVGCAFRHRVRLRARRSSVGTLTIWRSEGVPVALGSTRIVGCVHRPAPRNTANPERDLTER